MARFRFDRGPVLTGIGLGLWIVGIQGAMRFYVYHDGPHGWDLPFAVIFVGVMAIFGQVWFSKRKAIY